jgi:hypothetical protein
MGTRSLTRIHSEGRKSPVILSFYRQFDGYVKDGHGDELVAYLKPFTVVNGLSIHQPQPIANGMDCLAALMLCHFKGGLAGGIYISNETNEQEYNYDVYTVDDGKVGIEVSGGENRILLGETEPEFSQIVEFVYPDHSFDNKWRRLGLIEQTHEYVTGYDLNDGNKFKKFRVDKILGGKIFTSDKA